MCRLCSQDEDAGAALLIKSSEMFEWKQYFYSQMLLVKVTSVHFTQSSDTVNPNTSIHDRYIAYKP